MTELKLPVSLIKLEVVKVTKNVLKQLPHLDHTQFKKLVVDDKENGAARVVGWVHPIVLGGSYPLLIVKTDDGFAVFEAMNSTAKKYRQVFVA